jgi:phosphoserine phosphatase RsbU/P
MADILTTNAPKTVPVTPASDHLRVLVVDDDELLAEYIAIELEARGCRVRCVSSAQEALNALDETVDLLLTDWQMPGMDGMELVRRARQSRSSESHLHITMMTAREDAGARSSALKAGVDDFLYKPVDSVQLDLALATARRNRMLQRRLSRRNQLLARAHARTREALRAVRSDLDAAATLHERLLPRAEQLQGVRAAHLYRPATRLGGDTIGTNAVGEGLTLFFLIDVRGHGVPAALDSFHLHHRLKQFRPTGPEELKAAATRLNREIGERSDDSYATLVAGVIDAPGHQGWIVRAGHPPPVLLNERKMVELEECGSLPMGMFAEAEFAVQHFPFPPGARLAVYSDGLTECADRRGVEFGTRGLLDLMREYAESPLNALVERATKILDLRNPQDDVSLLALECSEVEEERV